MLAPGVADSGLNVELGTLRQRKYDLEQRMRQLQDSRRDLVGQLEHLMRMLKVRVDQIALQHTFQTDSTATRGFSSFAFDSQRYWR